MEIGKNLGKIAEEMSNYAGDKVRGAKSEVCKLGHNIADLGKATMGATAKIGSYATAQFSSKGVTESTVRSLLNRIIFKRGAAPPTQGSAPTHRGSTPSAPRGSSSPIGSTVKSSDLDGLDILEADYTAFKAQAAQRKKKDEGNSSEVLPEPLGMPLPKAPSDKPPITEDEVHGEVDNPEVLPEPLGMPLPEVPSGEPPITEDEAKGEWDDLKNFVNESTPSQTLVFNQKSPDKPALGNEIGYLDQHNKWYEMTPAKHDLRPEPDFEAGLTPEVDHYANPSLRPSSSGITAQKLERGIEKLDQAQEKRLNNPSSRWIKQKTVDFRMQLVFGQSFGKWDESQLDRL